MQMFEAPSFSDKIGITQFVLYLAILVLSVGVSYGALTVRLNSLEEKTSKYQADHELILILNTKMDQLAMDLKEIKLDIKEIKARR